MRAALFREEVWAALFRYAELRTTTGQGLERRTCLVMLPKRADIQGPLCISIQIIECLYLIAS